MKIIIGLGNPGKKYEKTRHNAGFIVVDGIVKNEELKMNQLNWKESKKTQALVCKTKINGEEIEFLKPTTFMNNSGVAVAYAIKNHFKLKPENIIVVHDDKDLSLGEIRIQTNRGSAGHNGVKSIIEHLGTQNFTRARIGVAPTGGQNMGDTAEFVLKKFTKEEQEMMNEIVEKAVKKIVTLIT